MKWNKSILQNLVIISHKISTATPKNVKQLPRERIWLIFEKCKFVLRIWQIWIKNLLFEIISMSLEVNTSFSLYILSKYVNFAWITFKTYDLFMSIELNCQYCLSQNSIHSSLDIILKIQNCWSIQWWTAEPKTRNHCCRGMQTAYHDSYVKHN